MPIDSHIQVTNAILKRFRCDNGKVWYLDLSTGYIGACGSDKLGTLPDYYSESMEKHLNRTIETPFSNYAARIVSFVNSLDETLTLPIGVEDAVKRFITAAFFRSKRALDLSVAESYTAPLLDPQINHDQAVGFGIGLSGGVLPMIRTHKLTVLINQTSRKYVVPRNCFYYISSEDHECYILPITPECALELIPEDYTSNIIDGKEYRVGRIGSPDDVWEMNKAALRSEYCFNKAFIASARKEELEELKDYLCDNKDYLSSLKSLFEG